jgi:hypothetical protein
MVPLRWQRVQDMLAWVTCGMHVWAHERKREGKHNKDGMAFKIQTTQEKK